MCVHLNIQYLAFRGCLQVCAPNQERQNNTWAVPNTSFTKRWNKFDVLPLFPSSRRPFCTPAPAAAVDFSRMYACMFVCMCA